ncbi:hypothetical protein MKW92_031715 [Papaver armeniacum]|nr:hypothetical protein MKW92_031715 [Papaver armeniacum]
MIKHTAVMGRLLAYNMILLLYVCGSVIGAVSLDQEKMVDSKVLNVGEELQRETLPLQMGSCLYRLNDSNHLLGMNFSIQLIRDKSDIEHNWNRRLLNTEKLIFNADSDDIPDHQSLDQSEKYVLVSVEPAGVLLLGIPHKAVWVGVLVFICLGIARIVPS